VKAPHFVYRRPATLEEAVALLSQHGPDAQILAGGQSLIPALNMRLSAPAMLVDINRIELLRGIGEKDRSLHIGALVRHCEVLESPMVARRMPLLASAMTHVAHMAVRNRGTTCGSLALADPAAELPAIAVLLDAALHLRSSSGPRDVRARDFFKGLYETTRRDDEIVTGVSFPCAAQDEIFHFNELCRRQGDFAIVGVALKGKRANGQIANMQAVVFGSEPAPLLAAATAGMSLTAATTDADLRDMAHVIADEMNPMESHQGRPETKRRQAAELLHRGFAAMRGQSHV
jgi:aerobic carbon-monoxide dehydrogenase medium subunit